MIKNTIIVFLIATVGMLVWYSNRIENSFWALTKLKNEPIIIYRCDKVME